MKRLVTLAVFLFSASFSTNTFAQDYPTKETRCWFASTSFTAGATVRAGAKVMSCGPDGAWIETDLEAAGCVSGNNFFGVGAIIPKKEKDRGDATA